MNCYNCGGEGWYADHSDACYAKGECVGSGCPVQRQCECSVPPVDYVSDHDGAMEMAYDACWRDMADA